MKSEQLGIDHCTRESEELLVGLVVQKRNNVNYVIWLRQQNLSRGEKRNNFGWLKISGDNSPREDKNLGFGSKSL